MSLNPKVTDQGNKVRLDWTPDLTGQGYRLYVDGVAVSRTFKPDASSSTFAKPDSGPHRYGVRKMDVVGALEEAMFPEPPPPPPPPPGCTQTISSGLAAAIQGAAAGAVICLQAGDYGRLALTDLQKSNVTVRPVQGAAVKIGRLNLQNVSGVKFTGETGSSLTIGGLDLDTATNGASKNLTFANAKFTADALLFTRGANQNILIDHCAFDDLAHGTYEGRITFRGFNNTQDAGMVVSNCHFSGGSSDGVQFIGGCRGITIGPGNEFVGLLQSSAGDGSHLDPIQVYDCGPVTIIGNWIHDNDTGIMGGDAGGPGTIIRDNVIKSLGASQAIYCNSVGWVCEHNVIYGTNAPNDMFFGLGNGGKSASGCRARDNVFANGRGLSTQGNWGTNDHNLNSGKSGPGEITGTPIFVGGANPTSYDGFRLAAGSPGKGAASDGSDMGI